MRSDAVTVRAHQLAFGDLFHDLSTTAGGGHGGDVSDFVGPNVIELHHVRRVRHPAVGTGVCFLDGLDLGNKFVSLSTSLVDVVLPVCLIVLGPRGSLRSTRFG